MLPAVSFVLSFASLPLVFGLGIAFSDWNLASPTDRKFNGLDNLRQMWADPFYGNALGNMVWYLLAILVEYAIAFGLGLLLDSQIRARKFFRVAFLLPLMLSPVAVSWMIGKSMMEIRFGPLARLARFFGWGEPSFFGTTEMARFIIMAMDAWTYIPFMIIMILAGLQAIPKELQEASKVDGANGWRGFWEVTFPLMLPVSITAILIRIIFKLKLADIIINVTSGGPGGATDSVTSFIFREYRDRANVGCGTMLAMVYLVIIIIGMTLLMKVADRWMRPKYWHDCTNFSRRTVRPMPPHQMVDRAYCGLCGVDRLGDHLPVPDLLDADHILQNGPGCDEGQYDPLGRLHAKMIGLEIDGAVARYDWGRVHSAG